MAASQVAYFRRDAKKAQAMELGMVVLLGRARA